ncbi:FGGY-family carbohydrate kinase [Nocardioides aurantiacus]|uniref:FGGY-family carbohydrate kinase n=1 Tax=Nocardioides aurantiacus TaxID=86796 RepID=UPI00403F886D
MTRYVLAVDGGSQSTKVSLVGLDGTVRSHAQVRLRPYALGPGGRAVHPDDDLWTTLAEAASRALAGVDPDEVAAVGLCGIRFCRALVGADDRLVEPVWSWMDDRVGGPHPTDDRTTLLTSAGGYLAVRLTGQRRDSAASLLGSWPVDPSTRRWSEDPSAHERSGLPRALLPELVDPFGLLGEVTLEAAAATGIPVGVPVYATANDKAVEALGCGLLEEGTTLLSLGTYVAAMAVGDLPPDPAGDEERYWVNAHAVPGRHLWESRGIRRGMWTVSWLRDLVGAGGDLDDDEVLAWLETGATEVPPGCGGLMTVPDWLPPAEAPYRRGVVWGLDGSHGPHHLYRSVLEGLVLTMRTHVDALEAALGRPSDRLVVAGGGSRSALLCQVVADVLDRPVERAGVADAAALGAAVCAAVGHGLHPDVETAVAAMTRPGPVVEPGQPAVAAYAGVHAVHARLVELLDPVHAEVAAARSVWAAPRPREGRVGRPV